MTKTPAQLRAQQKYLVNHPDRVALKKANWMKRIVSNIISHYSNGTNKCSCCSEDLIEFLTIDHIDGDGREHRRSIGYGGNAFFRWLKNNNYPTGFQVLCYNCNCARGIVGYCHSNYNTDISILTSHQQAYRAVRTNVLEHYGGKCKCCSISNYQFLNIDHIDGITDSTKPRHGTELYYWLLKQNFPEGFQILCWNCNLSKAHKGICPHEDIRRLEKELE